MLHSINFNSTNLHLLVNHAQIIYRWLKEMIDLPTSVTVILIHVIITIVHAARVKTLRGFLRWLLLPLPYSTTIQVPTMHQAYIQLKARSYHSTFPVGRTWSFHFITLLRVLITSSLTVAEDLFSLPEIPIQELHLLPTPY